jgi:hypothetical protein
MDGEPLPLPQCEAAAPAHRYLIIAFGAGMGVGSEMDVGSGIDVGSPMGCPPRADSQPGRAAAQLIFFGRTHDAPRQPQRCVT